MLIKKTRFSVKSVSPQIAERLYPINSDFTQDGEEINSLPADECPSLFAKPRWGLDRPLIGIFFHAVHTHITTV